MSSSAYPIIWALKHAPVIDAVERAVLLAIADHGDADGCCCYPSTKTMAKAALVDDRTALRARDRLARRGIIRRQPGPPPQRWLDIPAYLRPVVWEVMIPASWWLDAQLTEVNRMRKEKGRPPITHTMRPDLAPAPPKKIRADKGRPAPNRRRKEVRSGEPPVLKTGGEPPVLKTGDPLSSRQGTPCLEDRQPSCSDLPVKPSSSYAERPQPEREGGRPQQEEEERLSAPTDDKQERLAAPLGDLTAHALLGEATRQWVGHRLPTAAERSKLASRIAHALAGGATREGVVHALTRDLEPGQVRTSAVQVVMARTGQTGWAAQATPTGQARPALPPRCDDPRHDPYAHDSNRLLVDEEGRGLGQCPRCSASAISQQSPALPPLVPAARPETTADVYADRAAQARALLAERGIGT